MTKPTQSPPTQTNRGHIVAVRGNVVDVRFATQIPPPRQELRSGENNQVVLEVQSHLNADTVRTIALTATRGMPRDMPVTDTGHTLELPVGEALMGRMINVFGNAIDGKGEPETQQRLPIHRPPLPLSQPRTSSEIFATGIKIIDLLAPLERGGKGGLFGGASVGKTVLITGMIHNMVGRYSRVSLFCGIGERCRENLLAGAAAKTVVANLATTHCC